MQFHSVFRQKFTLEDATKAKREDEIELYSFFNIRTRWVWVVNTTPQLLYLLE
jgi:hypothetical protein